MNMLVFRPKAFATAALASLCLWGAIAYAAGFRPVHLGLRQHAIGIERRL